MFKRLVLMLLVLSVIGYALYSLQAQKAEELASMSSRKFPPASVAVATVVAERWRDSIFAVGSVSAEQGINVTAPLPGTVINIRFDSGQRVTRGAVLIEQDVGVQQVDQ